ncbi:hypothetical protein GGF32_002323 [Allomyces javanicus]|nr:hypothetical protein GGF32_002323 [Allomyces javanicus]
MTLSLCLRLPLQAPMPSPYLFPNGLRELTLRLHVGNNVIACLAQFIPPSLRKLIVVAPTAPHIPECQLDMLRNDNMYSHNFPIRPVLNPGTWSTLLGRLPRELITLNIHGYCLAAKLRAAAIAHQLARFPMLTDLAINENMGNSAGGLLEDALVPILAAIPPTAVRLNLNHFQVITNLISASALFQRNVRKIPTTHNQIAEFTDPDDRRFIAYAATTTRILDDDTTLTREKVTLEGNNVWRSAENRPATLPLDGYLTYGEMAISAQLAVSTPTLFINDGNRRNCDRTDEPGTLERFGIYIAAVGSRFEVRDEMEARFMYGTIARPPPTKAELEPEWAEFYDPFRGKCVLVATYPSDSNALPGNEYWAGLLMASGNSAAACSSHIPELQNPYINEAFLGRFIVHGDVE